MNIVQTTIQEFRTGVGTADATPKPIVAPGYARKAYKGVRVRSNIGTIYVGPRGVSAGNAFELTAGEELFIPIEDASKIYVVAPAGGTYSWVVA